MHSKLYILPIFWWIKQITCSCCGLCCCCRRRWACLSSQGYGAFRYDHERFSLRVVPNVGCGAEMGGFVALDSRTANKILDVHHPIRAVQKSLVSGVQIAFWINPMKRIQMQTLVEANGNTRRMPPGHWTIIVWPICLKSTKQKKEGKVTPICALKTEGKFDYNARLQIPLRLCVNQYEPCCVTQHNSLRVKMNP